MTSNVQAIFLFFILILVVLPKTCVVEAFINPIDKVINDYKALTRRVTARQILLPPGSEDACKSLKLSIMKRVEENSEFVVDVFEDAARKFSRDDTTNFRGGLLGELLPQGSCQSAILDEKCFQVPLGALYGPIESEYGIHLLLVSERINCQKLDGRDTKLIPSQESGYGQLVPSSSISKEQSTVTPSFLLGQASFWAFVFLAGGLVAEFAARITTVPTTGSL